MNDGKHNPIKKTLDEARKQLEELKKQNPDGNYEEIESMIQKMDDVLEDSQGYSARRILKKFFQMIVLFFVLCSIAIVIFFGFTNFLLNPAIPPLQYMAIVPITSFILYFVLRVITVVNNKIMTQHPILVLLICNVVGIIVLAILDQFCFQLCSSFENSILLAGGLCIIANVLDIYVMRKIYF
ncbi:MAG: hypothetical protein K2O22_04880 [Anaeroplasmataceae bacterium]|nr:hypothetical protein [Anaeroplasmataceae bacterium]